MSEYGRRMFSSAQADETIGTGKRAADPWATYDEPGEREPSYTDAVNQRPSRLTIVCARVIRLVEDVKRDECGSYRFTAEQGGSPPLQGWVADRSDVAPAILSQTIEKHGC